ncbi:hypothetical protein BDY24DRAFT_398086 [Mrakia frigida]|uniref:NADH dehydrogenase [ubiquinone] 1 alpha subcomplex subunit 1 n=1 Tax=Mrakia frigida TaxID=29902 RepID=UPI003FCC20D9
MPFPWEATIPFIALMGFLQLSGQVLDVTQRADNLGKAKRMFLDDFEVGMMERDRRLTGHKRGQRDDPNPPAWFATNKVLATVEAKSGRPGQKPSWADIKSQYWDQRYW